MIDEEAEVDELPREAAQDLWSNEYLVGVRSAAPYFLEGRLTVELGDQKILERLYSEEPLLHRILDDEVCCSLFFDLLDHEVRPEGERRSGELLGGVEHWRGGGLSRRPEGEAAPRAMDPRGEPSRVQMDFAGATFAADRIFCRRHRGPFRQVMLRQWDVSEGTHFR